MRWISDRGCRVVAAMLVMLVGLCVPGWASAQVSSLVYVANRQAATVSVIDARTATVIAPAIAVGNGPSAVIATRDGRFAYVLNHDSDSISVIDGATLTVIKTITLPAGSDLQTATFNIDESMLLVAGESTGTIFQIDVGSNSLAPTPLNVGPVSGHFALNTFGNSGNDLWIGLPDKTLRETFLFDTTVNANSYALPALVNDIAFSGNAIDVYISHPGLTTLSRVHVNQLAPAVDLGFVPTQILIDRGKLFVAGGAAHVVLIIEAFTAAIVDTIDVVREATRLAVSPDGRTLYVSHGPDDGVSVVDIAARTVSAPIAVGHLPGALATGPATIVDDGLGTGVTLTSADDLMALGFTRYLPFAPGGILRAPAAPFTTLHLKTVMLGGDGIVDTGESTLELDGTPYGPGRLVKRGAGMLQITCNNNVEEREGRVFVETGSLTGCATAAQVVLNAGSTLAADTSAFADVIAPAGSIIDLRGFGLSANTVIMAAGATLRPHVIAGNMTVVGPPVFAFFNGALYGNGTAQLNGATLELAMPATNDTAFRPPNASAFTIVTHAQGTFAGLAEGRVGGPNAFQTYILLANPGDTAADVTVTFLRGNGSTLVKTFTVAPTSRFNVGVTGPDSAVPELVNESFGADIVSSQPIAVERSMYSDANGVIWAAGTNATASRLP